MISNFKLPFSFDPQSLKLDLEQVSDHDWKAHFNNGYFEGQWTGVALRSFDGSIRQINPSFRGSGSFTDTPLLDLCPHVSAVLATFKCHLRSVRFLRLAAGSLIKEHRDHDLGIGEGQVRFHIPVTTNPEVDFFLDAHRIEMNEGECWYLDLSLPHWVENRGATDRIHLVIDCELNEWLREILPFNNSNGAEVKMARTEDEEFSPTAADLERFRQTVLGDLSLQRRLRQTADRESFIRLIVTVGHEHGYRFTAEHVQDALRAAQRDWIERWID